MTSQTSTASQTADRDALVATYSDLAAAYVAARAAHAEAPTDATQAAYRSLDAKLANQSRRIREAELDLTLDGVEFVPWKKPVTTTKRPRKNAKPAMTQPEIEAALAPIARVFHDQAKPKSVRDSADSRIGSLLRTADRYGYQIEDPRIAS